MVYMVSYDCQSEVGFSSFLLTVLVFLCFSLLGDLWSGSDGGALKVWPWEAIEKALSMTLGESQMATLLVERSYIDLRTQVSVGFSNTFTWDVKFLLSDESTAKVWSGSDLSFAIWYVSSYGIVTLGYLLFLQLNLVY